MFCSNCGTQLPDDADFCSNCGQKVGASMPADETASQPQSASNPAEAAPQAAPDNQPDTMSNAAAKAEAAADKIGAAAEVAADKVGAAAEVAAEKAGAAAEVAVAKTSNFFKTKFLPGVKKYLKWIIVGVVVILAVIAFFVTGNVMSNPSNVVAGFLSNMANGNYAAAFGQLDVEESEFVNGEIFAQYISEQGEDYSQYRDYRVMSYNDYVRQQARQYGIGGSELADALVEEGDGSTLSYVAVAPDDSDGIQFTLVKQDSNFLLFWPTYKLDAEDLLADATIYTLPDSTVAIDGINVPAGTADEDTPEGCVPYTVPSLLSGDHTLTISNPLSEDYESEISVYSGYTRTVDDLTLSEEMIQDRFTASQELVKTLVNGAIANTAFDDLGVAVTSDAEDLADIKESYDDLLADLHDDDGTGLKSITFTDFEDTSYYDDLGSDLTYDSRVRFRYDYVATVMDYGTDQLTDEASTYTHSSTFSVEYTYENGSWVLSGINNLYISY